MKTSSDKRGGDEMDEGWRQASSIYPRQISCIKAYSKYNSKIQYYCDAAIA